MSILPIRRRTVPGLLLTLFLALAMPPAARAQYSEIEENPLVPAVSEFYGFETVHAVTVMQNVTEPDDLLVTLFLARASGRSPVEINGMRKLARSWQQLFQQFGVNQGVLFQDLVGVQIPERYPDYVWAQRKYKEWKARPSAGLPLYDKTVRLLVGLDFTMRRFDLSALETMKARQNARSYLDLVTRRLQPAR